MKTFVVLIAILCAARPLFAQDAPASVEGYAVMAWTTESGFPAEADAVIAITQDREGYLWLGTRSGLFRFDGLQFILWGSRGEPALPGRSVRNLITSDDGSLWMTFDDADRVSRIRNGLLTTYAESDGLPTGVIRGILEDRAGHVWAGGVTGLASFDGTAWRRVDEGESPRTDVLSLYEDQSGTLWAGTGAGVFRRPGGSSAFEMFDPTATNALSFAEDARGVMWVTDSERAVRQLAGHDPLDWPNDVPRPTSATRLLRDRHGQVWVAAYGGGLLRVRQNRDSRRAQVQAFSPASRIKGTVLSLFEDREQNIWVGMRGGLERFSQRFVTTEIALEGMNSEGVRAVTVGGDGSVWVGTTYRLHRFTEGRRELQDFTRTMALHTDRAGNVWVATPTTIGRFSGGRMERLVSPPPGQVSAMTVDAQGTLWLCRRGRGLFRRDEDQFHALQLPAGIDDQVCSGLYSDRAGRLWIGFPTGGVVVYDGEGFRPYSEQDGLAAGGVIAISEDKAGAIWVVTVSGLSRLHEDRVTTLASRNGLPGKIERSIVEDDLGYLWLRVSGGAAVIRFSRDEVTKVAANPLHQVQYALYDESDGLPPVLPVPTWSGPVTARDRSGALWLATGAGVAVIDPRRLPASRRPASPRINSIVADGRPFDPLQEIALPNTGSTLQIDYSALSLSSARKLRFRYMLEGFSGDWVYAGARREAFYANLAPGSYRFRVTATNDGLWNEPEAIWNFSIQPAYYQTTAFYVICIALAGSAMWGYWSWSVRSVRRKYAVVLAERTRMSREIHDTLLQSLTAVGLEVGVAASHLRTAEGPAVEAIERVRGQVQQCIAEARQAIWELRSPRLETRSLEEALRDMADHGHWGTAVRIETEVVGSPRRRSPVVEEQVLRITREAITNAVRHGRSALIRITVTHRPNALLLRITDDGCGFDPEGLPPSGAHYGIAGMRERAERLGGRVHITSRPGQWTVVELSIPIR